MTKSRQSLAKDYPEYNPNEARGKDGKWTAGGGTGSSSSKPKPSGYSGNAKYVLPALAALGLLGGVGAAIRFGPAVARYLATAVRGAATKPSFMRGLRDAVRADAYRVATARRGAAAGAVGAFAGAAARGARQDAARARAYVQRTKERRRARYMERGHKRFSELIKGYPEYHSDQPRDEGGQWDGGGGSRRAGRPSTVRDFESSVRATSRVSTPRQAHVALKGSVASYERVKKLPDDSGVWRDPTLLDRAWKTYKNSVLSAIGISTLTGVSVVGGAVGGILGGAHVHPLHSAVSAMLMSVAPNTTTFVSYQAATKYLSVLFPKEAKYAFTVVRLLPVIAGGIALLGAALASSLALRYAYRKYQTGGTYRGVDSFNTRLKELDGHIAAINIRLNTLSSMQRDLGAHKSASKALTFKAAINKGSEIKCSDGFRLA